MTGSSARDLEVSRAPEGLVIGPIYVRPTSRRRGVATMLIHRIELWARGAGIPIVEVSVTTDNEAGVRFLGSVGFVVRRQLMARIASASSADPDLEEVAE